MQSSNQIISRDRHDSNDLFAHKFPNLFYCFKVRGLGWPLNGGYVLLLQLCNNLTCILGWSIVMLKQESPPPPTSPIPHPSTPKHRTDPHVITPSSISGIEPQCCLISSFSGNPRLLFFGLIFGTVFTGIWLVVRPQIWSMHSKYCDLWHLRYQYIFSGC